MGSKRSEASSSQLPEELEVLHHRLAELEKLAAVHQEERQKLIRVNRFLRAVRQCNEALIHAPSEMDLMQEICRIIVEVGGYRLAWVGQTGHDAAKTVRPVAQAGDEDGYLSAVRISWDETENGRGPVGTCIRTRRPVALRNLSAASEIDPWLREAAGRGYQAVQAIPLLDEEEAFGALAIYATEPDAFDREELGLLRELADDLSFGIVTLRSRGERRQAEAAAEAAQQERASIFQAIGNPSLILDENRKIISANKAMAAVTGLTEAELIGKNCCEVLHPGTPRDCPVGRSLSSSPAQTVERVLETLGGVFMVSCTPEYDREGRLWRVIVIASDITEYQRMAEAMSQSEEKFRLLAENAQDLIFRYRLLPTRGFDYVSPAARALTGYSPEELYARPQLWFGSIHPDDRSILEAALTSPERFNLPFIFRVLRPPDQMLWVEQHHTPILNAEGRLEAIVGIARDITQRKRAEEALRESEGKYKSLIDNFKDIIFTIDLKGKVTFASPSTKEILGYESAETINMNILDFIPEEDRQKALETLPKGMQGKKITHYQTPALTKSGERVFLELSFSRLYRDGVVVGAQAIAKDVTERKRTEEALRQTHLAIEASRSFLVLANLHLEVPQLLRAFISETKNYMGCEAVGIRLLDEDGDIPYQAYEGFDRKFYETESPLSTKRDQCMCINVVKGETDPNRSFYTAGGSFYMNGTTRFLATVPEEEKGKTRNVCNQAGYESVALVPIRFADRILGLVHVADPREAQVPLEKVQNLESMAAQLGNALQRIWAAEALKRAEAEVRKHRDHLQELVEARTAQLEATNQELQAFSYSVSHDLRAPLRAIQGFSNILLEDHAAQLDAEGKRCLDIVATNTKQMGTLIDDLLTLSRLGRAEMQLREVDLKELAQNVFIELRQSCPERKLEFTVSDLAPVRGDRGLLRQVLVNLLSNAVKFTRPREIGVIQVGCHQEKDETIYYVQDNGVGYEMKYGNKLFGVFQRLHRTEEFEGTGVGLAIVQRIIYRHGGRVWAEGKLGEGATFYFTLGRVKRDA